MRNERNEVVFETIEFCQFFLNPLQGIDFAQVGNNSNRSPARNGRTRKENRNKFPGLRFKNALVLRCVSVLSNFVILSDGIRAFFVPKYVGFLADDVVELISEKLAKFRIRINGAFPFVSDPYTFLHGIENFFQTVYPDFFQSRTRIEVRSVSTDVWHWD